METQILNRRANLTEAQQKKQSEAPPIDYIMDLTLPRREKQSKTQQNLDYIAKELLKQK